MAATEPTHATRWRDSRGLLRPDFGRRALSRAIVYATLTGAVIVTYAVSVVLLRSLLPARHRTPWRCSRPARPPSWRSPCATACSAGEPAPVRRPRRPVSGDRPAGTPPGGIVGADEVPDTSWSTRWPQACACRSRPWSSPTATAHPGGGPWLRADRRRRPAVPPAPYRGEELGHLDHGAALAGRSLNRADRRLLADLGRQAGPPPRPRG